MSLCNDEAVSWITEKVAMSGSKGLSTDEIWSILNLHSKQMDTVDELWKCLTLEPELVLHKSGQSTSEIIPSSYSSQHSFDETIKKYGRSLYWTASSAKQTHYLLQDQKLTLPSLQRTILEKIGSSGAAGIAQCVIATELDLKPQTIFHHLKKLQSLQLITKAPSIYHGQYTNTCVHTHYLKSDNSTMPSNTSGTLDSQIHLSPIGLDGAIRYDDTAEKMNQLLSKAKDKTMALSDLIRLTGFTSTQHLKWARKFLAKQHADGFVEKILATANGKKIMCVKLIKPISISPQKVSLTRSDHSHAIDNGHSPTKEKGPLQEKCRTLTREDIIKYIGSKHGNGCTNKDLYHTFSYSSKTSINNMMLKLRAAQDPDLVAIKELQGRCHVFYYFSKDGFNEYQSINGGINSILPSTNDISNIDNHSSTGSENEGERNTRTNITPIQPNSPKTKRRLILEEPESKRKRPINSTNPTSNTQETSHHSTRDVNLTMTRRKAALLNIINRDKVRDFNLQLFTEIQSMDGSDKKHKLAQKTVQRLVDSLEKEGLLRLIKVMPNYIFGGNQPRTLVMSPELNECDRTVTDYLEKQRTDVMIPPVRSVNNGTPLKTVDTEVKRYGCSLQQYEVLSGRHWRFIAKRHGWIDSKWLRAKELHLFLVKSLLQQQGGSTTLASDMERTISLTNLIGTMPLDLFKKVIGIHHHDSTLEEFMEINRELDLALVDIPDDIKHHLIPNPYQMRRRVQALLSILEILELVQPLTITQVNASSPSNNTTYTIQIVGIIRNYTLCDRPVLAEKDFTSLETVIDYWNELQYTCACVYGTETDRSSIKAKRNGDPLSTITLSRTWTNGDLITVDQKQQLDQHVDFSLGKIPDIDWAFVLQLSRITGLLPYRIRSYYLNLGTAFAKRNRLRQQLLNEQHLAGTGDKDSRPSSSTINTNGKRKRPLDNTMQILLQASKEKKALSQAPDHSRHTNVAFSSPTFVGSRPVRRKYIKDLDESTLKIHDRSPLNVKRTIQPFTPSEKSTFVYAVAIMRYRARESKFYWAPITQVIPEKSIRQCASRLQSLLALNSPSLQTIDNLQQKWARIYERGLKNKEIVDERPWDTRNFDLAGYMTYFLTQLSLDDRSPSPVESSITLPVNANIIHSMHIVTPVAHSSFGPSEKSKHGLVKTSPNTMGATSSGDKGHDELSIAVANAIQMIKMIMVHPEETFDSHLAYNLLSQFQIESVEQAHTYLKAYGMVVLSKHGDNLRVPGRKFRMSNSFILALAGPVSKQLYEDAFDFHQHVYLGQPIPENLSGGAMMALLNLISQDKIALVNETNEQFMQHISSLAYPSPNPHHDSFIEHWIRKHGNVRIHTENESTLTPSLPNPMTSQTKQSVSMITSSAAERYMQSPRLESMQYVKHVYGALDEFGVNGATSLDLKLKMKSLQVPLTDKELLETLEALMDHTPSLVVRVGYDDLIWICIPHAKNWMMKAATSTAETYLRMNLWCNLDGGINQEMLYVCCCSLVGHIQSKPGISQDDLERQYRGSLSNAECQQALDVLVHNGVIYYRSVIKQPKVSLFSKPSLETIAKSPRDEVVRVLEGTIESCMNRDLTLDNIHTPVKFSQFGGVT